MPILIEQGLKLKLIFLKILGNNSQIYADVLLYFIDYCKIYQN